MTLAASINLLSSELFFCLYFIILINMPYSLYSKPYRQPIDLINDLKGKNLTQRRNIPYLKFKQNYCS